MRLKSGHDSSRSADPEAYWRRRFFILVGGLVVVVGIAWLLSGKGHGTPASSPTTALRAGDTLPSAAYGSAWPGATPTLGTSPSAAASRAQPTSSSASSGAGISQTPVASTSSGVAGSRCAPADIVLSLFTSQASYTQSARPSFDVYAVSTASSPCQMAYGAGSVRVVVTRNGQVVWDSRSCGSPAAKTIQFQRGVPQLLTVTWNRAATSPSGCAGSLAKGAWGTFDAVALTAGRSSPVRTFTLSR
jgi:hypothetical protein